MNTGMERQDGAARVYQAPTLKVFGNVVELTASGTGTRPESVAAGGRRCASDRNKTPCKL